ncbi:hypothetical protein GCM10009574_010420 [Streptomyces asiaticus]|uniref:Uncharacterized protein n=2 Tax=Streptomyces rhizosphaericus TaxID=114699 RepID=A0ABP4D7C8_9ACTN
MAKKRADSSTELVGWDARGGGIGAALPKRCVQVCWRLEYMPLFGEFETGRDLGAYSPPTSSEVTPS